MNLLLLFPQSLFRSLRASNCQMDCSTAKRRLVCGTDGLTYSSPCELKRAKKCDGRRVKVRKKGRCSGKWCLAEKLSVALPVCMYVCLSVSLPACLSVCLPAYEYLFTTDLSSSLLLLLPLLLPPPLLLLLLQLLLLLLFFFLFFFLFYMRVHV